MSLQKISIKKKKNNIYDDNACPQFRILDVIKGIKYIFAHGKSISLQDLGWTTLIEACAR